MSHQIIEHVLHPTPATQVEHAASELQLVVETRTDEKDRTKSPSISAVIRRPATSAI